MCCMEMMTAVNYGIPLNVVVINNGTLGLIRKNQFQLYGERYIDCDFVNPDFAPARAVLRHRALAHRNATPTSTPCSPSADLAGTHQPHRNPAGTRHAFPRYLSAR